MHLVNGDIGIIDTFNNPLNTRSEALEYLDRQDISYSKVVFVIVSHLHRDHIGGLISLFESCSNAKFYFSSIITSPPFNGIVALSKHANIEIPGFQQSRKIYRFIKRNGIEIESIQEGKVIYDFDNCKITAIYPNEKSINYFLSKYEIIYEEIDEELKSNNSKNKKQTKKYNISSDFNHHSVALIISFNDLNYLHCSDLVFHDENGMGAAYVFDYLIQNNLKCHFFKLPHHGSNTGFDKEKWSAFIEEPKYLKTTAWRGAGESLPEPNTVGEILSLSENSYCTTNPRTSTIDIPNNLKRKYKLPIGNVRPFSNKYGVVVFSKNSDTSRISVDSKNAVHFKELL